MIYNILAFEPSELYKSECRIDFENYLFFNNRKDSKDKINCKFIKILYYLNDNYIFSYRDLYKDIEDSIYKSYKLYSNKNKFINITL